MLSRVRDIEGSLYNSVSKYLEECVVDKEIYYVPTFIVKKGIIKKAELEGTTFKIYVSKGAYISHLFLTIGIIAAAFGIANMLN